ncbi:MULTISPECIES: HigA family addiction module antitoxin [unclassified Cupriavidus]|jgi:antitoxin HigA-1|uniref:HigA family addiction module antitoxin n=1 Tax=unclassified Cupriavidus TaxID=2640874 RepID=UPI001C000171|nr:MULTISPECIES: HigA family addiction module antitoxin [unclassified Cupriavidus]MCA3185660.1 HigA family addiction module antidote protein [Cupriavidus sp.]MCA3194580.1 HigA family addiction module antidote protein [Cupriavidus sp.]MCA3199923.1 HigA family addiction module antidote protein [Cupriavidus sp.]MCA3205565.1 HigA family addiction module antidote protein [Cupriavidus sp.]MCA3205934.1 HigA family addiction module antidote protein [Cupriavidus sp.]
MQKIENGLRPVHPGEVLREEFLVPLDMTANALAGMLHVTPARINEIVRGERGVTPVTALRLARYFGGTAEFWMNLQQTYDLKIARLEHEAEIFAEIQPRQVNPA